MREKLRIVFWVVVVKIARAKARWNSRSIEQLGAAIRSPAIADRRSTTWLDARAGAIAELTDDVSCRSFTRVLPRFWNFVKSINHPDLFFGPG